MSETRRPQPAAAAGARACGQDRPEEVIRAFLRHLAQIEDGRRRDGGNARGGAR